MYPAKPRQHFSGIVTARVAARTHVGLVREHNEDRYLVADLQLKQRSFLSVDVSGHGVLLGVCDGMGGAAAGEVASFIAVDTVISEMEKDAASSDADFAERLVRAIEAADAAIARDASKNTQNHGMGTTCTVAGCRGATLFVGQVGDSRAYLFRRGVLTQITKDQSLVNELVALGTLSPEAAQASSRSNVILQALGRTDGLTVDLTSLPLRRDDRLLVCSDGLNKTVSDEEIARQLAHQPDLEACCEALIQLANAAGGPDNTTVVLCEFIGEGLKAAASNELPQYQPYVLADRRGAPTAAEQLSSLATAVYEEVQATNRPDRGWRYALGAALLLLVAVVVVSLSSHRNVDGGGTRSSVAHAGAGSAKAPAGAHVQLREARPVPTVAPVPARPRRDTAAPIVAPPLVVATPPKTPARSKPEPVREKALPLPVPPPTDEVPWNQQNTAATNPFK